MKNAAAIKSGKPLREVRLPAECLISRALLAEEIPRWLVFPWTIKGLVELAAELFTAEDGVFREHRSNIHKAACTFLTRFFSKFYKVH